MVETIEYCLRNVDSETRDRLLGAGASACPDAGADGADVLEQRCLQRCGTCYSEEFLVVDGDVETAGSHATLLATHGIGEER
jgi:uncharacterized protein YuzB (UPF0349 family)